MQIYKATSDRAVIDWQWHEPSLRNITHLLLKYVPTGGGRALDVGCGTGRVAFALAELGFDVDGVDADERAIRLAKDIGQETGSAVRFRLADFRNPGVVEDRCYDVAVCSEVLEHVEDYRPLIDNMHRALKPGGRLIVSVPYDPAKWSVLDEYCGHVRRFTVPQITSDLRRFSNLKITVTGFPFYRMLVRVYLLKIRVLGQEHSTAALWERSSTRTLSRLIYLFARLDNLFAFTRLGGAMIVAAER